jgi:hypothetical protein
MEIDSETILSPPIAVQREIDIILDEPIDQVDPISPAYLVAPSNIPRDIIVGHKMPVGAR